MRRFCPPPSITALRITVRRFSKSRSPGNRRPITCGAVRVSFIARKRLAEVATQSFNTPRGPILVSSVEATAVDLIGYEKRAGGLDNVATVLSELAERIDPDLLPIAASAAPIPWAQRLGLMLDHVGAADKAAPLKAHVQRHARDIAPLLPAGRNDSRSPLRRGLADAHQRGVRGGSVIPRRLHHRVAKTGALDS